MVPRLTDEELNDKFKQLYHRFTKRNSESILDVNELLAITQSMPAPWYS